ncbi:MAG: DUF1887 family CARF protein [Candidatus Binatia bacterium]
MNVMLCLLSDQPIPNLLSVHHLKPDRLILIESEEMQKKKTADHFLQALQFGGLDYAQRAEIHPLDLVDDLEAVRQCLRKAYGSHSTANWIANLTGGTKPMSIAAYEFFKAVGARLLYVNATRPDEMLRLDGSQPEKCSHHLSIAEFLAAYGFTSTKADDKIAEAEARADRWWSLARIIAEYIPDRDLLSINREEWATIREKGLELKSDHIIDLPSEVKTALQATFDLAPAGNSLTGKVDKYVGKFLTGEWLEVFFWKLLQTHAAALAIDSVRLGVEVRQKDNPVPTDFDVAFIRRHALGVVECKSGAQEQMDDPNAPLDKLEARSQQFRALRVNPVLATTSTSPKMLDEKGQLKANIAARARLYNSRIVTVYQIQELARSPDSAEKLHRVLFG